MPILVRLVTSVSPSLYALPWTAPSQYGLNFPMKVLYPICSSRISYKKINNIKRMKNISALKLAAMQSSLATMKMKSNFTLVSSAVIGYGDLFHWLSNNGLFRR